MKLAIDSQISFLALAIASKKLSKTISETHTKWLQFGTVSETWGLALSLGLIVSLHFVSKASMKRPLALAASAETSLHFAAVVTAQTTGLCFKSCCSLFLFLSDQCDQILCG